MSDSRSRRFLGGSPSSLSLSSGSRASLGSVAPRTSGALLPIAALGPPGPYTGPEPVPTVTDDSPADRPTLRWACAESISDTYSPQQ